MTRIVRSMHLVRRIASAALVLAITLASRTAHAQLADLYPNFWTLESPAGAVPILDSSIVRGEPA